MNKSSPSVSFTAKSFLYLNKYNCLRRQRDAGLLWLTSWGTHIQSLTFSCFLDGRFDTEQFFSWEAAYPLSSWHIYSLAAFWFDWLQLFCHQITFWTPTQFSFEFSIHVIHFHCYLFILVQYPVLKSFTN